jgi:hypothetical protein
VTFDDTLARARDLDALLAAPLAKEHPGMTDQKPAKPKSGGLFFSLIDEIEASERRLDAQAEPLLREMQETEALAARAIETRRDKLATTRDYIKRVHGIADELSEGNGGPPLDGAASSPTPSDSSAEGSQ